MKTAQPKEADTQRLILDWLKAKRIWHIRLNTGAVKASYGGKSRFIRFGVPGMADIFAMVYRRGQYFPVWIEVKSPDGRQSAEQINFREEVVMNGMCYVLARNLDDVIRTLNLG